VGPVPASHGMHASALVEFVRGLTWPNSHSKHSRRCENVPVLSHAVQELLEVARDGEKGASSGQREQRPGEPNSPASQGKAEHSIATDLRAGTEYK
jgi:hypothetical protein